MDTMKKCCQNLTNTGIEECGLKVGAKCMADRSNTFIITPDFIKKLKVVGCKSYSKYMEWNDGNTNTMSELQEHKMVENRRGSSGSIPEGRIGKTEDPSPMRSLQPGNTDRRGSTDNIRPSHCDIMTRKRITCMVCGIPAVAMGSDGIYLCATHQEKKKAGWTLGNLMKKWEEEGV
jgi:hypothetical protein